MKQMQVYDYGLDVSVLGERNVEDHKFNECQRTRLPSDRKKWTY